MSSSARIKLIVHKVDETLANIWPGPHGLRSPIRVMRRASCSLHACLVLSAGRLRGAMAASQL